MIRAPDAMGPVHFVGIGGIGMSGIAEVLHNQGYSVQGSDIAESASVKRLRRFGIPVAIGHSSDNVGKGECGCCLLGHRPPTTPKSPRPGAPGFPSCAGPRCWAN